MNAICYLNTPPLNGPDDPNYIGGSSWRNSKVGRWNLSYDSISSDIAPSEQFKNKTGETDTEESDQVKVTTFVYEHPPTTSFYKFYTPPPVTRGLI